MKMEEIYTNLSQTLKALSDPKRLKITDMLSCGEICACQILDYFQVTQPTLSHDMKVLMDAGIVKSRREGKNIYYSLDEKNLEKLSQSLTRIFTKKEHCVCEDLNCNCGEGCCDGE
jgi:ArsR family transcriptional regulator